MQKICQSANQNQKSFRFRPRRKQSVTLIPLSSPSIKCTNCAFSTPFLGVPKLRYVYKPSFSFDNFWLSYSKTAFYGQFLLSKCKYFHRFGFDLAFPWLSTAEPPFNANYRNGVETDCACIIDKFVPKWHTNTIAISRAAMVRNGHNSQLLWEVVFCPNIVTAQPPDL